MRGSEGVSWGVPRGWDPGPPPSSQREIRAAIWQTLQHAGDSRRCGIQGGGGGQRGGSRTARVACEGNSRSEAGDGCRFESSAGGAPLSVYNFLLQEVPPYPVLGSLRHRRTSVAQVSEGLELPFPQNYISKPSFSE